MGDIKVSDGARKLREYLTENELSIPRFCDAGRERGLELDRIAIKRVLDGERGQRVTVDFAKAISDATGGVVAIEMWASDTLRATGTES